MLEANTSAIKLLVGLGNPGSAYEKTRHNAGKWLVRQFCDTQQIPLKPGSKFQADLGLFEQDGIQIRIALPLTYMNETGMAVSRIMQFYKIPETALLVVHDDLDLPPGVIRLKTGGGFGGHNGLKSISQHLAQTRQFHRLRIGIGHPGQKHLVHDYVLNRPPQNEVNQINDAISTSLPLLPSILSGKHWQRIMNQLHQKQG